MAKSDNLNTRYLNRDEYDLWDRFVDRSAEGTIFHKSYWLSTFATWQHLQLRIAGCFKGDELAGGMAFTFKRKYGMIKVMQVPLKTPFFGPVLSDTETKYLSRTENHRHSVICSLIDFVMSEIGMFTAVLTPPFEDIRPFIWNGFSPGIHYTYIKEISNDTDLLDCYDSSVRRQIKKGEQQDYTFHTDNTKDFIFKARELEQRSFERQKLNLDYASGNDFFSFISDLAEKGNAQTYTIKQGDTAVASQIVIFDLPKKMAYYWLAGAEKQYLSTGLNQLLLHLVLKDIQEKGFRGFDFVGAGTESIARYKSTFNFPLVSMHSVTRTRGVTRLLLQIKEMIR